MQGSEIKEWVRRQQFRPTRLGLLVNPFYLIRRRLFQAVSREAPTMEGTLLDFGCGQKPYEPLFAHAVSYTGVDIAVSGHNHATSKVDVFYDGKVLPFGDESFDGVVSFEVLEHVFDIDATLGEIRRVLKPGGQLLVSVPLMWGEHEQPFDFGRYTEFGFRHVLERNGFVVESLHRSGHAVEALSQLGFSYLWTAIAGRNLALRLLLHGLVFVPLSLVAAIAGRVLPADTAIYCNLVVRARQDKAQSAHIGSPS